MQIEAIYDQGKLQFLKPVKFLHQRFPVKLEISPQEIVPTEASHTPSGHAVFDNYSLSPQALSFAMQWWENLLKPMPYWVSDDDGSVLSDKQNQYWDAFEFRARFYAEQGKLL